MEPVCGILVIFIAFWKYGETACVFPAGLQNNNWTSSGFGNMEFFESNVTFIDDTTTSLTYTCYLSSGSSYVIKSPTTVELGTNVNHYYCFQLTQLTTFSFSYYLLTTLDINGHRKKTLPDTSNFTSTSDVCDMSPIVAELYVLVQRDSPSSAAVTCTAPLLGNFQYTTTTSTGTSSCGTSPGDGILGVCDGNSTTVVYDLTACSTELSYSDSGILYCIAATSAAVGGTTTYYQILYNSDANPTIPSYPFTCMALSYNATSSSLVYASEIHTTCVENQNATSAVTGGNLIFFQANVTCGPTSGEGGANIGLIVGLVILALVLLAVIAALLFYCCYWKKRDPNAGKPIVENTKPRFEDPDKEEILEDLEFDDARSEPLTRDDIVFTAESPVFAAMNGHATMANGHASGSGLTPNTGKDSGIALTDCSKTNGKPTPVLNREREAMVIFNGDEKVISGNDSRVVPAENPQSFRRFQTDTERSGGGPLTLQGLEDEDEDELAGLSNREVAYPTLPERKSNLLPPIETIDPEKETKYVNL